MTRLLRCCVPMLCAGMIITLSAAGQAAPAPGGGQRTPAKPTNLKVLPETADLRKLMHQYEADLGVECEFCHAAPDPTTHRADRASDANPVKDKARYMIKMTDDLNGKYLAQMPGRQDADAITCGTCHRGEKHPPAFVAAVAAPAATH